MDEEFAEPTRIDRARLHALQARSDRPGAIRIGVQLAALGALVGAMVAVPAAAPVPALPAGLVVASFFAPMHECLHRTAFRSRRANAVVGAISAFVMLSSPTGFRALHFEHHRHTHDPLRDPEISLAPWFLARWGPFPQWLARLTGLPLLLGQIAGALAGALAPAKLPFVPVADRRRVAWESRAVVLGWSALAAACVVVPGLWGLLLAQLVAHVALAAWLGTEHTDLPHEGTILERTRTVPSNAVVRFFTWNMGYHAEHHGWPAVPFHALPALHALVGPGLPHTTPGYLREHVRALTRRPQPE